jgi:hypothetical protein
MSVLSTSVAVLTVVTGVTSPWPEGLSGAALRVLPAANDKAGFPGNVVAVIPARDEAEVIRPVVTSLFNQGLAMSVILVDDESHRRHSRCRTSRAEIAGNADALIVIHSKLAAGMGGKLYGPATVAKLGLIASQGPYDPVSFR